MLSDLSVVSLPAAKKRRLLRVASHQPIVLWLSVAWLVVIAGAAVLAPVLPLDDPAALNLGAVSAPPSLAHPLGTDDLSRDMLSRIIWGARASLFIGLGAVLLALVVGGALGLVAGYAKGPIDAVVGATSEVMLSFPLFVLSIAITGFIGHGAFQVAIAIAVALAPTFLRVARGTTRSVLQRDYILAALSVGTPPWRLLAQDILPNVLSTLITLATTLTGVAIVAEGSLSFLGVGIQPPTPSWGSMIAEGRDVLATAPHVSLEPAAVMFLTVLALTLIGDHFQARYLDVGSLA